MFLIFDNSIIHRTHIGCLDSWTSLLGVCPSLQKKVGIKLIPKKENRGDSFSFLAVGEMMLVLLNLVDDDEDEHQLTAEEIKERKKEILKKKILSVSRMMRMYSILRSVSSLSTIHIE